MVILADLDGTLVTRGRSDTGECAALIREVAASGDTLIPVSARPVPLLARMFADFPEIRIVVGSGGGVVSLVRGGSLSKVVWERPIPASELSPIVSELAGARRRLGGAVFFFRCSTYNFELSVAVDDTSQGPSERDLRDIAGVRPLKVVRLVELHDEPLLGISLLTMASVETLSELACRVKSREVVRYVVYPEFRLDGWNWLEFQHIEANKFTSSAHALAALTTGSSVDPRVVALGDAMDDIAMFRLATVSYCPSDASPATKEAASLVVDAVGGREFSEAVRRLLSAGRRERAWSTSCDEDTS